MAWNEPGGGNSGDKDPWGNRNNDGPPDLDEAFKKLGNNLTQLFGQGGNSGSSGGPGLLSGLNKGIFLLLFVAAIVVYIVLGVYTVDQQERGVVLRFGKKIRSN